MERLAHEIEHLAREIQRDLDGLLGGGNVSNQSVESAQRAAEALERIQRTLAAVHGQTTELVERVRKDLGVVLADLQSTLILRLGELVQATQSDESGVSRRRPMPNQANQPNQSPLSAAKSLSPQERRVFELCFQLGFLSYRDIACRLDFTPTAAKNLINRLFQSDRKRPLFVKEYRHGAVRVSVRPDMQSQILAGRGRENMGQRRKTGDVEVDATQP